MSVLPVIVRELRAQSRQPLTYWLRIVAGLSLACALGLALWAASARVLPVWIGGGAPISPNPIRTFGSALFGKLNLFIFAAIWLFVPLAAADAVSRERREGTLVLLYLTELRSWGILVGKAFVHMLRSLSLFLTMAPWLMLPVIFGGVELRDIRMALLLDATAVLLAMAAGLLASTIPRDWLKAVILAEIFSAILLVMMLSVHGAVLKHAVNVGVPVGLRPGTPAYWRSGLAELHELVGQYHQEGLIARSTKLLALTTNGSFREPDYWYYYSPGGAPGLNSHWQQIWTRLKPPAHRAWLSGSIAMLFGSGLVLAGAIWLGAWRVSNSWRDAPHSDEVSDLRRRFFAPRYAVSLLTGKLSRALTANPIGWLQIYSPSARMVKWAWCLFIIVVEIIFCAHPEDIYGAQAGLGLLLLLGMTFSATGSFRQELETGAFELLLVSPLRERQIITGRARGLWRQFLPSFLVYAAGAVYLASGWSDRTYARQAFLLLERTFVGFCALPFIGLYFSVQRWNFFVAWMAACAVGLLPAALARAFGAREAYIAALQLGTALVLVLLLHRRLKKRQFLEVRA